MEISYYRIPAQPTSCNSRGRVQVLQPSKQEREGATNINYTLPLAAAAVNGYVLSSTTGGAMSWTDPATLATSDWHLTGNTGTTAWNGAIGNIIGTLDAQDFVIGTGAVAGTREKVRITQAGNLQLSQPGTQLSFLGTSTGVTTFQAGAQGANTV